MRRLILIATILTAGALVLPAQQGRGGEPRAFGDKDKDGICDVTGKPVGQGRAAMRAGQEGQTVAGRGRRCGRGRGNRGQGKGRMGQGQGRGMRGQQQKAPEAAPAEEAK